MRSPVPTFLMVDPAHYEVGYTINPWMSPADWRAHAGELHGAAQASSAALAGALRAAGARVEILPGTPGAPDLVFPANAATVFDGRLILARFLHPERQVEEPHFARAFAHYRDQGWLDDVAGLPAGCVHEGAGDFIHDLHRGFFWAGFGQRSNRAGGQAVAEFLGVGAVFLELATPRFYHLDTCFCPLPGGEVLYYPPAFTPAALAAIETHVAPEQRLVASEADARAFCVNAVAFGRDVVMAAAPPALRAPLAAGGYRLHEVDLAPFILSGGGAYCMTLRLDRGTPATDTANATITDTRTTPESTP